MPIRIARHHLTGVRASADLIAANYSSVSG
jgi:hypothetical protein